MYTARIRIPKEQYAFIEVDVKGTPEEIKLIYNQMMATDKGLEDKEWRCVLDQYLSKGEMESNEYERMSMFQVGVIQEIKKSFKRINKQ